VVLDKLADFLAKSEVSKAKIKSALFYPAIVLGACVLSLCRPLCLCRSALPTLLRRYACRPAVS